MNLGPLIAGLGTARLGYSQGRNKQVSANREREDEVKQLMFKLALEKSARDQTQGNTDREYELRKRGMEQEISRDAFNQSQPKAPPTLQLGSPGHLEAQTAIEEMRTAANIKQAKTIAALPARPTYSDLHPKPDKEDGPFSPTASRKESMADAFAQRMVEAYDGDYERAIKETEKNPTQKAQASLLKVTAQHYFAAASRIKKKETGTVDAEKYKTDPEYRAFVDSRKE